MNNGAMSIWIGYDPREADAFAVTRHSIRRRLILPIPIYGLVLPTLRCRGLYTRPTSRENGRLIDHLSKRPDYDGAMSTEFAISRFLVPHLAEKGWALFLDADMLVRCDIYKLFKLADPTKAVQVVKHDYQPGTGVKMDGQLQVNYDRKNWSSVMLFNVEHPANRRLTLEMVNTLPGRELHRFCWLDDDEIGHLEPEWNYLVGATQDVADPKIVHFTSGVPSMPGYENCRFADEWRAELTRWAS